MACNTDSLGVCQAQHSFPLVWAYPHAEACFVAVLILGITFLAGWLVLTQPKDEDA